jgi:hypothetical protein
LLSRSEIVTESGSFQSVELIASQSVVARKAANPRTMFLRRCGCT